MSKIVYWSEDDGALYLPEHVDDVPNDGSEPKEGFRRYRVPDSFTLTAEDICTGQNDVIEVLLQHDPPFAEALDSY